MTDAARILRLPHAEGLPLPAYETAGSAGMDLRAAIPEGEALTLAPGARTLVPTGLKIALPQGLEAQVRPRSGLALKHGVTCLNSPGTIDSDYRGEIGIILENRGHAVFEWEAGDRLAQGIVCPIMRAILYEGELDDTTRGASGYGSTGK